MADARISALATEVSATPDSVARVSGLVAELSYENSPPGRISALVVEVSYSESPATDNVQVLAACNQRRCRYWLQRVSRRIGS